MSQTYLCTRPRLAAMLIRSGTRCTQTKNPFAADRSTFRNAWEVELTPSSAAMIEMYFSKIGRPIPDPVRSYLHGRGDC